MNQIQKYKSELQEAFREIINKCSIENDCNMPDFIIASHLYSALENLSKTVQETVHWSVNEYSENDYDDSMDGDAASALVSAGLGTDEDYGGTDERL